MNSKLEEKATVTNDTVVDNDQSRWIEETFNKRECIKFVQDEKNTSKCMCGRLRSSHPNTNEGILRTTYPVSEKWGFSTHTELSSTDAYGTIEFQGGPHPTKAQYVRLSFDTKPEKIVHLLHHHWGLDIPKLLISVHGGIANFDLQPKLRRVCKQGLFSAAKTTGAWVTTGGTNTGVMKHVGEALGDTLVQSRHNIITIGIAPWGVVHKREDLIGRNTSVPYLAISLPGSDNIVLNSSHSYFLLVDDGSVGRFGCETVLRKSLEKYISQQRVANSRGYKDYGTPVVCLLMEGGSNCIRTVLECVTDHPPIPVVVIDGSGRASDLLSFTHKYAQPDGTMPEVLKEQLLATIARTFMYGPVACERVFTELMLCTKQKSLMTIFRIGEEAQDIDQAILTALLKNQNASSLYQLNLTMAWNRVDMARNHIFAYGHLWPEGALDNAMMEALVSDRVDFVRLLIENGVNMTKWLTIKRLEDLYNQVLNAPRPVQVKHMHISGARAKLDSTSTLRYLLTEHKRSLPVNYRFTLYDIGQVINKLMGGGYQAIYGRRKFRLLHNAAKNKQSFRGSVISAAAAATTASAATVSADEGNLLLSAGFKYPYSELMIWAVLIRRQKMAMFMWERGEESLAKCLVAAKLYKGMAKEAEEDEYEIDVANEIRQYHVQFFDMATELLDHCYKTDEDLTQLLLTYELNNWSNQTCLSLAVAGSNKSFVSHTCCQLLLTQMWMGGLRTRKYPSLKIILGILCFPSILFFSYRSREELEMMPQPQDDHEHYSDASSTDSDSDFSDTENAAILQTLQQQQQQLQQLQLPSVIVEVPGSPSKPSTTTPAASEATSIAAAAAAASGNNLLDGSNKNTSPSVSVLQHQRSQKHRFSQHFGPLSRTRSKKHHRSKSNVAEVNIPKEVPKINLEKHSQLHIASKIFEFYTAPITKFWLHAIGYCIFILLFIYMILQSTPIYFPSIIEWYIFAYMCGITLEKIREFLTSEATKVRQKVRIFFTDVWNLVDMVSATFFLIGFTIRFWPDLISSARAFYCLTVTVCVIRVVDFFVISPRLGPFVHITGKMLKEFMYLLVFILVLMASFGTFRQSLWFPDNDFEWESVREIFLKPYFMLYGEVYHEIVWPDCEDNVTASIDFDQFKCVSGRWMVPVAQSIFLAAGIIVLLSLVIAVFNGIFMKTYMQSNIVWKFQRYMLVIEYEAKPILPSPFIIISHAIMLVRFVVQRCILKRKRFDQGLKVFLHEEDLEKLHDFEEECMEIYHREKTQLATSTSDYSIKQTVEKLERTSNRLDDIQQKENSISQCLLMMELHLSRIEEISLSCSTSLWTLQQQFQMLEQQQQLTMAQQLSPQQQQQLQQQLSQHQQQLLQSNVAGGFTPKTAFAAAATKPGADLVKQASVETDQRRSDVTDTSVSKDLKSIRSVSETTPPITKSLSATPTTTATLTATQMRMRRGTKGSATVLPSGRHTGTRSSSDGGGGGGGGANASNNNNNNNANIVTETGFVRQGRAYSDYAESANYYGDDKVSSLSRMPSQYRAAEQKFSSFYPPNRYVDLHYNQPPEKSNKYDAKFRFLQQHHSSQQQQQQLSPQLVHLLPFSQQQQQQQQQQQRYEPQQQQQQRQQPNDAQSFLMPPNPLLQLPPAHPLLRSPYNRYNTAEGGSGWKKYAYFPLTPIVTPMRVEYTSITDDIDTSSFLLNDSNYSPPDSPLPYPQPHKKRSTSTAPSITQSFMWPADRMKSGSGITGGGNKRVKKKKSRTGGFRKISTASAGKASRESDRLKEAEENVSEQMKTVVKRRMRQLSLTEPDNEYGYLAKYALETIEFPEEDDEDDFENDDEDNDEFHPDCEACVSTASHQRRLRNRVEVGDGGMFLQPGKFPLCKSDDDLRNVADYSRTTDSHLGSLTTDAKKHHHHHHHHRLQQQQQQGPNRRRQRNYNETDESSDVTGGGSRGGKLKGVRSEPSMIIPDLAAAMRGVSNNLITLKEGSKEEEEEEERLMLRLKNNGPDDGSKEGHVGSDGEDKNARFVIGGGDSSSFGNQTSPAGSLSSAKRLNVNVDRLMAEDEFDGIEMKRLSFRDIDRPHQPQQQQLQQPANQLQQQPQPQQHQQQQQQQPQGVHLLNDTTIDPATTATSTTTTNTISNA